MTQTALARVNRLLLLATSLLAGYQIAVGMDGLANLPVAAYTVAFGVLLVAALLVLILGFEAFDRQVVVYLSTVIPLSFAVGLVCQTLPALQWPALGFAVFSLAGLYALRTFSASKRAGLAALVVVHAVSGITIVSLPVVLTAAGSVLPGFLFVSVGGAVMSLGGLLLSLQRAGKTILTREKAVLAMPALLFLMTLALISGFRLR